jgi:H+-translocating diphosphatase
VSDLGMLSTIATCLAIDAYGHMSDNAGGIVEMAGMSHSIRERTDAFRCCRKQHCCIWKGRLHACLIKVSCGCTMNS